MNVALLKKKLQKVFWIYVTENGIVCSERDCRPVVTAKKTEVVRITPENCHRVREFREEERVSEYKSKLAKNEIGYFAECEGKMAGSFWATANRTSKPMIAKGYMRLLPNEAMIHDCVTSGECRGLNIAPFMVWQLSSSLLTEFKVNKIIIDVNFKNAPALRMLSKAGVPVKERVFYFSLFGTLLFQKRLKLYS